MAPGGLSAQTPSLTYFLSVAVFSFGLLLSKLCIDYTLVPDLNNLIFWFGFQKICMFFDFRENNNMALERIE